MVAYSTMLAFLGSDAAKVLFPIVGLILVALINAVLVWAKELNSSARRIRLLDEGTKTVQFWDLWFKTLSQINDDTSQEMLRLEHELRRTADIVSVGPTNGPMKRKWTVETFAAYRRSLSGWRRFFLLYEQPNYVAHIYRVGAYLGLIYPFFVRLTIPLQQRHLPHWIVEWRAKEPHHYHPVWGWCLISLVGFGFSAYYRWQSVRQEAKFLPSGHRRYRFSE